MDCQTSVIHRTTKAQILPYLLLHVNVHTNLVPRVLSFSLAPQEQVGEDTEKEDACILGY